jgi:site-specific recombinase XerD
LATLIVQSDAYKQFVNSLRAKQTKITYTEWLNDFLRYVDVPDCGKLLTGEYTAKQIQSKIIEYVIDMKDNRGLSPNSIRNRISAIQHFFEINDYEGINWKKVKKFKGEFYTMVDDRPYTREEISTLIDNAHSLRNKAIILLFGSSGLRVGGLIRLQLKHLKRVEKYNIYQIEVYKKSREAYTTFCTSEARQAIDSYLAWRERLGEKLTPESPLFRTEFNTEDRTQTGSTTSILAGDCYRYLWS